MYLLWCIHTVINEQPSYAPAIKEVYCKQTDPLPPTDRLARSSCKEPACKPAPLPFPTAQRRPAEHPEMGWPQVSQGDATGDHAAWAGSLSPSRLRGWETLPNPAWKRINRAQFSCRKLGEIPPYKQSAELCTGGSFWTDWRCCVAAV